MILYINSNTGVVTDALASKTPLRSIEMKHGDTFTLACVFHDGAAAVELPADVAGVFIVKNENRYIEGPLILRDDWKKQPAPENGYVFTFQVSSLPLYGALGGAAKLSTMAEVTWQSGAVVRSTPTFSVVIHNDVYRDNEPPPSPEQEWPLPGAIALKADLDALRGEVESALSCIPAGIPTGRRMRAPDGSVWEETLAPTANGVTVKVRWRKLDTEALTDPEE